MTTEVWSPAERAAWRLPAKISVSEWADEHRVLLPRTSAEPGAWRTDRTPYLREIQDAFSDPFVEEITVMKATQLGGTEAMYNMLGYAIDQDPGPALLVMPREEDARGVSNNRVLPMIEASPALSKHVSKSASDVTRLEYRLDHMSVYFAGSNSPAALASRAIRYLWLDEVDKFPKFSGRESDPIKLATERTRTFWNRKIIKISTPTTRDGYVFREYEKSDQRRYFVSCPFCGVYQPLVFSNIRWPEGERDPEKVKNERLAWYRCAKCEKRIEDKHRPRMIDGGVWVPEGLTVGKNGKLRGKFEDTGHRGFWISALYSPWLTWSEIAAEFLRSKNYSELLMNFINSWLAEIWEEKAHEMLPDELAGNVSRYSEGTVPAGAMILTAGVDVQKDHFYGIVRGWGVGEESWLIRACRMESWEDVERLIIHATFPRDGSGEDVPVRLACVDSGYRTSEVYEFCRTWREIARAIKGHQFLRGAPYRVSMIDRHPGSGAPIRGGLSLWHVDVSHFRDKIARLVSTEPGDPGQWHLFEEISEEYARQFCAYKKVVERDRRSGIAREIWKLRVYGADDHYNSCEVYAAAGADMLRVSTMRPPGEAPAPEPARERTGSWLRGGRGGRWIR